MRSFRFSTAFAALALSLAPGITPHASAQEPLARPWRLALWAQTGYQHPTGRFAKNSPSDIPQFGLIDALAEFGGSQMHGGGVEVTLPAEGVNFRLGWETTTGAEATGYLGICKVIDGSLCREEVAPMSMRGLLVEARSSAAGPQRRFAPVIGLGFGLRWYDFSVPGCAGTSGDAKRVCEAITDLYRDSKPNLVLRLGAGMRGHLSGLLAEVGASVGVGRYKGGAGRSSGLWYQDVRINLSVGAVLF